MNINNQTLKSIILSTVLLTLSPQVSAVGNGLTFVVQEDHIANSASHSFLANSLDFTYHACVIPNGSGGLRETGYFLISSYQDNNSVVDSQINLFRIPGYHIYGLYNYDSQTVGSTQNTPTGTRQNYVVNPQMAEITLYLDEKSDTDIAFANNCDLIITDNINDVEMGTSTMLAQGEKTVTNGLANGDFELVFTNWTFSNLSSSTNNESYNPMYPNPMRMYDYLHFNGNITQVSGPLSNVHFTEGSGNLFWQETFIPLPWNCTEQPCPITEPCLPGAACPAE